MLSKPLFGYVMTAALRDKLVISLILMIILSASLATFMGGAAITEQGAFSAVFGAAGLRFLGVTGIVLFVCFYIRRSFETKEVEFLLSRPLSRMTFLFTHASAFAVLALLVAVLVLLGVALPGTAQPDGIALWGLSIAIEYILMALTALFFAMMIASAAGAALASLGFYVFARLIGTLIGISRVPAEKTIYTVLNNVVELISVIIPRFDLMGQTSWLVYGARGAGGLNLGEHASAYAQFLLAHAGATGFICLQGGVFGALIFIATAFDFSRREF